MKKCRNTKNGKNLGSKKSDLSSEESAFSKRVLGLSKFLVLQNASERSMTATFVALILNLLTIQQKPDWATNYGKSPLYPESLYLTGFGMDKVGRENDRVSSIRRAIDIARGYLAQNVTVTIQSKSVFSTVEHNEKISSFFSAGVQASSSLEIAGINVDEYFDEDEQISYAFAHVLRDDIARLYTEKELSLEQKIRQHVKLAQSFEQTGPKTKALGEYLSCYPLFDELETTRVVLSFVRSSLSKTFNGPGDAISQYETNRTLIQNAVHALVQRPINSVNDLAWYIAYCLSEQIKDSIFHVQVVAFNYEDTKMASPFSRLLKVLLENELTKVGKWTPITPVPELSESDLGTRQITDRISSSHHVLRGTYWPEKDKIRFIAILSRTADGSLIAGVDAVISDSIVSKIGLSMKSANFEAALRDEELFSHDDAVGRGVRLEIWTNKGHNDLVFSKGETLRVYLRVNMPCYIRFLYHLANGKRVLLLDNHFVAESKLNKIYLIPQEFYCDEPFGVEVLQAYASRDPFERLKTEIIGGYDVLQEDFRGFLTKQRGLKALLTEKRLTINTVEDK